MTRRRIERDLYDGVQQHLISSNLTLRTAQAAAPPAARELAEGLDKVIDGMGRVIDELREIARRIHPPALAQAGLHPALKALGCRFTVPVRLDVRVEGRLPEQIEVAAYYAIAEAMTMRRNTRGPQSLTLRSTSLAACFAFTSTTTGVVARSRQRAPGWSASRTVSRRSAASYG